MSPEHKKMSCFRLFSYFISEERVSLAMRNGRFRYSSVRVTYEPQADVS